ncbi:MAG: LemA family protein [Gammaproteobacteria bacterium]
MVANLILLAVLVAVGLWVVGLYNGLVRLREGVRAAWSNIGVVLKQRHEELPKLVEACRQYMAHEQATLERVMQARGAVASAQGSGNIAALGAAEGRLRAGLGQLFALVEAYPDLKADTGFAQLAARISALEDQIADRRELYNDSVNLNNIRVDSVPDVFIARACGFQRAALLEFTATETADIDLRQLFRN